MISNPRFWIPVACSFFLTLAGVILGAASAGAGHGNYLPVMILFPFAMLVTGFLELGFPYLIALSAVQFPIYGVLIGQGSVKGRFGSRLLLVLLIHGIGVALVLLFAERGAW
jgi:hypothetical protein